MTTVTARPGAVLVQALWFGLLTGIGEAALVGIKRLALGRIVRVGADLAWMAPLADALAFLTVGLMLVVAARLWKPFGHPRVAPFVFAFFGFLSLLLMYYPLHLYAKVLLALGLAVQAARLFDRWPAMFGRLVRRSLAVIVPLVGLAAVVAYVGPRLAYERHVAGLPAAQAGAPNVLLIVWDTVRAKNLSLYGYERRTTPNLEKWAGTGTVFENASSTSPWTLPAHASILTGQWPQELSASWEQPLDHRPRTLAETLGARGYVTAGFVANTYYCGHELGIARGFARYEDYVASPQELLISSTLVRNIANSWTVRRALNYHDNLPRQSAWAITNHFLDWHSTTSGRPFFAFLNYFDAHETYLPPPPFDEMFGPGPPAGSPAVIQDVRRSFRRDWAQRPAAEIQGELNMYDGAIAYLDDQINRLLETLQARGALNDTIVIVTSDHGEHFGEHGLFLHGNSLYQPLLHVPLILRFPPAVPASRRVASRVTLRDLPATVLDLLGNGNAAELPGLSLSRYWSERAGAGVAGTAAIAEVREAEWARQGTPWYPVAKGDMESVTDDAYHYIRNGDGTEELYAIAADPEERRNLSGLEENRPILARYRAALRASSGKDRR